MATKSFSAQVDDIILVNEKRMLALVRESTQRVIDEAQTPVAKGGKMRVDTGFLRASGRIGFNSVPAGVVRDADAKKSYEFDIAPIALELGNIKLGDTVFFTWSANYAAYREAYDGFLSSAVQNWPQIVTQVTEEIRQRIKK